MDNDLLDEFVHDGGGQLGDIHVLFHQSGEAVVVVAVFSLLVDQFFHDGDLGLEPLLLFFIIRHHFLIAIIRERAENVIFVQPCDQLINVLQTLLCLCQLLLVLLDAAVLRLAGGLHPLLLKALRILPDVGGHCANAFQHNVPQYFLSDVVACAFATIIFIAGTPVMILLPFKALAGGKVHSPSAVRAVGDTGKHAFPFCSLDAAMPLLTKLLHPIP